MKFVANDSGDFENPEPGMCPAVLIAVIDLGTEEGRHSEYKPRRRVMMRWELDQKMADGRPFIANQWLTASFHEKARLRQQFEAWRGKAYGEGEEMVPKNALGRAALLNITINERGYTDISSVNPMPKNMPKPKAVGDLLFWDMDDPDWDVWECLSDKMRERIERTPEYRACSGQAEANAAVPGVAAAAAMAGAGQAGDGAVAAFDDDIPF